MAYSLEVVQRARQRLAGLKADRESQYQQRLQEAYRENPRLRQIDQQLRQTMVTAAQAAFSHGGDVAAMIEEYDMRRRLIVSGFNKLGLTCREPKGAFYAFPCISSTGMTSEEFCEQLLYEKKVAIVPGPAFGQGGEGFVRASYCYSTEHIQEALRRIGEFLNEHGLRK